VVFRFVLLILKDLWLKGDLVREEFSLWINLCIKLLGFTLLFVGNTFESAGKRPIFG
jgi:hypothetical protein